jgi:hypothetical protein
MNLARSFATLGALRASLPPDTYVVEAVEAPQVTYLACSPDGRPGLFIAVQGDESPGIRLRNMEMRHRTVGNLRTSDGGGITGTYTLIECLSHDARLHQAFLELASDVLRRDTPWLNTLDLEQGFTTLVELFRAVSMPSPSSWLGAWGELFLMHASPSPEALLATWHVDPMKLHDFSLGTERLECKTTALNTRVHEFSLSQVGEADRQVYIASVVTHETLGGVSALTLYDELRRRVRRPSLRVHLDTIVARMLGENLDSAAAPRFDYEEARQTLRVFAAAAVPAPTNAYPNEVDNVRFRSDLSGCAPITLETPLLRLVG